MKKAKGRYAHFLTEYFTFAPLKYAFYNGKPLKDNINEGIRRKIFKQIITASNEGMFIFASNHKKDLSSMWGVRKYGKFLTYEDYLELYEFAHTVRPQHGKFLSLIGLLYEQQFKNNEEAEKCFHRAVELAQPEVSKKNLGNYMFLEAKSMALQGRYSEAVKLAESVPEDRVSNMFKKYLKNDVPKWKKASKK